MRHPDQALDSVMRARGTILLFGGVTLEGFENARRLADLWTLGDSGVVWFDGFPGAKPPHQKTEGLLVVDYGDRERNRRLNRLERRGTETIARIGEDSPTSGATASVTHTPDRFVARLLKRWNTATRGYANWRLIRRDVLALSERLTPAEVVYCDDHALTAAWHAARLWPDSPVRRAPAS